MQTEINTLFSGIIDRGILKKAVFSKSDDKSVAKLVVTPFSKKGVTMLAAESFNADNKAIRKNHDLSPELLIDAVGKFRQANIFTTAGDLEIRRSKSDSVHIAGKLSKDAEKAEVADHDSKKRYIIGENDAKFLCELGLADATGRIHDKSQSKFRQINRFLEIIRDVEDKLPTDRPPVIYDLCCGKSYLTFAVYYYFTVIKNRPVRMYGVDLKADVIDFCNKAAARQSFTDLRFVPGNINEYNPPEKPDMVISLHACDIATDIVLYNSIRWNAGMILSTPCCHHEMSKQLNIKVENAPLRREYDFILSSPMLRQKFCDTLTDALRVKRLASVGYDVTTLELIDPDETPKNLMIRAVLDPRKSEEAKAADLAEYRRITEGLGVHPFLDKLLTEAPGASAEAHTAPTADASSSAQHEN